MSVSGRKFLYPQYMGQFQCTGSKCEDTCCAGWRVTIDKKTYKMYKNHRGKEMSQRFNKDIQRNRQSGSDADYALIDFHDKPSCPFLNENKLCDIHSKCGEEMLSYTCTIYPRTVNVVDGVYERSASFSCPEVARLALLNQEPMEFNETVEITNPGDRFGNVVNGRINTSEENEHKYFWDMRIFTIQTLQNRQYSLWERLIILGLLYSSVNKEILSGNFQSIPLIIERYSTSIESGIYKEALKDTPAYVSIQIDILKAIIDFRNSAGIKSERYKECLEDFIDGLGYTKDIDMKDLEKNYIEAYENYYKPFMDKHEYILENYLVNYVFKNLFPFTKFGNVFENYVILIIHYSLIKMLLIGMAGHYEEEFDLSHVMKLIQSFAKTNEHSDKFISVVAEWLKEKGITNMEHMAILIKN